MPVPAEARAVEKGRGRRPAGVQSCPLAPADAPVAMLASTSYLARRRRACEPRPLRPPSPRSRAPAATPAVAARAAAASCTMPRPSCAPAAALLTLAANAVPAVAAASGVARLPVLLMLPASPRAAAASCRRRGPHAAAASRGRRTVSTSCELAKGMREAEDGKQQIRFGRLGCVVVGTGKRKERQIRFGVCGRGKRNEPSRPGAQVIHVWAKLK